MGAGVVAGHEHDGVAGAEGFDAAWSALPSLSVRARSSGNGAPRCCCEGNVGRRGQGQRRGVEAGRQQNHREADRRASWLALASGDDAARKPRSAIRSIACDKRNARVTRLAGHGAGAVQFALLLRAVARPGRAAVRSAARAAIASSRTGRIGRGSAAHRMQQPHHATPPPGTASRPGRTRRPLRGAGAESSAGMKSILRTPASARTSRGRCPPCTSGASHQVASAWASTEGTISHTVSSACAASATSATAAEPAAAGP